MIARADENRLGLAEVTAYELWQLADKASGGVKSYRVGIYRHAAIHAGHISSNVDGDVYETCPICGERLR